MAATIQRKPARRQIKAEFIASRPRPSSTFVGGTLALDILHRLREDIVTCVLKPGQRLKFAGMRNAYDASFSTIREALSTLTAEGLVVADGQRGFTVAPVSVNDLENLTDARVLLEKEALATAIKYGDDAWEANILASFHRLSRADVKSGAERSIDPEWAARHRDFHRALLAACPSPILLEFAANLYERAQRYRRLSALVSMPTDKVADHRAIMEACLSRDSDRACRLLERHLRRTAENIINLPALKAFDS